MLPLRSHTPIRIFHRFRGYSPRMVEHWSEYCFWGMYFTQVRPPRPLGLVPAGSDRAARRYLDLLPLEYGVRLSPTTMRSPLNTKQKSVNQGLSNMSR